MKKINYFLMLIFVGCSWACTDLLDEDPSHIGTAETYFPTIDGFNGGVNACYAQLRPMHNDKTIWLIGTDQFQRSGFPNDRTSFNNYNEYSPSALHAETGTFKSFWDRAYIGINRCNTVIGLADKIEVDAQTKNKRLAEVKALRALYYFYLVEQFGDVPFPLEPYEELQITAERVPESVIYEQLISDLKECLILPEAPDQFGRVTKGAVQFLLAKLYLTRGYKSYKQNDDFINAAKYSDELINSGAFRLLPEFHKIFVPGNEKNDEIIFSVQWCNDPILNMLNEGSTIGNNIHSKFGIPYDHYSGGIRSSYYNRQQRTFCETYHTMDCFGVDTVNNIGKSFVVPNQFDALADPPSELSYKQDKRYNATFLRLYMAERTILNFKKSYGTETAKSWNIFAKTDGKHNEETLLRYTEKEEHINTNYWIGTGKDTCLYIPAPDEIKFWTEEMRNSVPYAVCNHEHWNRNDIWRDVAQPVVFKFWEAQTTYDDNKGVRDMFLFRLGEAYLIAAEAHFKAGDMGKAVERVNTIRRRANGVDITTPSIMDISAADLDIDFILDERTRELVGEEHRWVELKRTGKLIERTLKYNIYAGSEYATTKYISEYHYLRPLPYSWLSLLRNEVPQNPGYANQN